MTGSRSANEHRPLLLTPAHTTNTLADDPALLLRSTMAATTATASSSSTMLRYTSLRTASGSSPAAISPSCFYAQQSASQLSRKYVVDDVVDQKRGRSQPVPVPTVLAATTTTTTMLTTSTGYGTMALAIDVNDSDDDDVDTNDNNRRQHHHHHHHSRSPAKKRAAAALRSLLCKLDDPRKSATRVEADHPSDASCSNQSETESDSDGSCGSNTNSSTSTGSGSLQSILRLRDGVYACRKVKKQASVEFRLDGAVAREVEDVDRRTLGALSCASSCMPRRLTIEEKAALYRVRPDLQLTPLPLLMRELDEIRRRRQRRLMFSALGGSLILLMMVVFYYLLTETP